MYRKFKGAEMNIHTFIRKIDWYNLNLDKENARYYLDYHVNIFKKGKFHTYYEDLAESIYALAIVIAEVEGYESRWADVYLVPESLDEILEQYKPNAEAADLLVWAKSLRWKVNEMGNQTLACRLSHVVMKELEKIYGKKWGVDIEFVNNAAYGDTITIFGKEDLLYLSDRNLGMGRFANIRIDGVDYPVDGSFSFSGGGFKTKMADGSDIDNTYLTHYRIGFVSNVQIPIREYMPQTCEHDKYMCGLIVYEIESPASGGRISGKGVLRMHPYGLPNKYRYEIERILEQ